MTPVLVEATSEFETFSLKLSKEEQIYPIQFHICCLLTCARQRNGEIFGEIYFFSQSYFAIILQRQPLCFTFSQALLNSAQDNLVLSTGLIM